jgi:hypothetical protein
MFIAGYPATFFDGAKMRELKVAEAFQSTIF